MVNGIPTTTVNIMTSDTMTRAGQNYKINKRIWELIDEQNNISSDDVEEILADFNARLDAIEPCDDEALSAMLDELESQHGLTKELVAEVLEEMLKEPGLLLMTYDTKEEKSLFIDDLKHTGNITIDWGDGAVEEISDENQNKFTHNYVDNLESHVIKINGNVTSIEDNCFWSLTGLTSITIPDSVTSLGNDCFHDCSGLTSITIPNSVTNIKSYCFFGCTSLTSITIPDSVTSIGHACFGHCTSLTSITIPNSVTSIGGSCFINCTSLTSIQLNWTTASTISTYNNDLIRGSASDLKFHIPSGTTDLYTAKGYPSDKLVEMEREL